MIRLEELPADKGAKQRRKRVGRGESSGRGRTSGRGNKGAGQRSGFKKQRGHIGGQTPLHRRVPKRGFSNDPWSQPVSIVNLSQLARFEEDARVDAAALVEAGIIGKNAVIVKILGDGEISTKLTVVADRFSASAREKIEKAGGVCEAPAAAANTGEAAGEEG